MNEWSSISQDDCFSEKVVLLEQRERRFQRVCKLLARDAPLKLQLLVKSRRTDGERGRDKPERRRKTGEKRMEVARLRKNQQRMEERNEELYLQ